MPFAGDAGFAPQVWVFALTRIFRFDVNLGNAVAANIQGVGMDYLSVPSNLTSNITGKHPTKSLSQTCHGLVHLLLIKETAVLITSFGV